MAALDILASSWFWSCVFTTVIPMLAIWFAIVMLSYKIVENDRKRIDSNIIINGHMQGVKDSLQVDIKTLSARIDTVAGIVSPRKLQHGTVCERCGCDINVDNEKLSYDDLNFYNAEVTCPACGSVSIFTMQVANVVCCRED